jgi:ABC-type oligopeptide transport system ATPase subunit
MPKRHPTEETEETILYFIDRLLHYGISTNLSPKIQITATWNKANLEIVTEIDQLIKLLPPSATKHRSLPQQKEHLTYLLHKILKGKLNILQDDRPKNTSKQRQRQHQGIKTGKFTLKLWHPPTQQDYILLNKSALKYHWNKTYKITPQITRLRLNLPQPQHTKFIGHEADLQTLFSLLASNRHQIIEIVGMAGIGKTTLALEAARQRLADRHFGNIIFSSAQSQQFSGFTLTRSYIPGRNLQELIQNIASTLDCLHELPLTLEAQVQHTRKILGQTPTLLIIDNVENLTDQTEVIGFLSCLPPTVKIIITSRVRLGIGQVIDLNPLTQMESLDLIKHQAQTRSLPMTSAQMRIINDRTGGLPIAITYLVSLISVAGYQALDELQQLPLAKRDIALYCFGKIMEELRSCPDQTAYQILLTLSLVPDGATIVAITQINQLTASLAHQGFQQLHQISLVFPRTPEKYYLHSLTQEYAQQDLLPDHAAQLYQRWQTWYLELLTPYSALDWQDWQDYGPLVAEWKNLCMAVDWSINQEKYADVLQFWQCLKGVSLLGGYWPEREQWLQWLETKAHQQQDLATIAELKYHRSFTLGFINESDEDGQAIALALAAWELHPHLSIDRQFDLMMYIVCLRIRKPPSHPNRATDLASAKDWLERGLKFLATFPTHHPRYHRSYFQFYYYQAEIHLIEGQTDLAYDHYQQANQIAKKAGSKRFLQFSSVRMALILVQRGELAEAEKRLSAARELTQAFHDRRADTFCLKNLAEIKKAQGNFVKAKEFADQAKASFHQLGMFREAGIVDRFLQDLNTTAPNRKPTKLRSLS